MRACYKRSAHLPAMLLIQNGMFENPHHAPPEFLVGLGELEPQLVCKALRGKGLGSVIWNGEQKAKAPSGVSAAWPLTTPL
jgi:hypothetical protein